MYGRGGRVWRKGSVGVDWLARGGMAEEIPEIGLDESMRHVQRISQLKAWHHDGSQFCENMFIGFIRARLAYLNAVQVCISNFLLLCLPPTPRWVSHMFIRTLGN